MVTDFGSLDVRPYQLMCCFCRLGRRQNDAYYFEQRLDEILRVVADNPNAPMTLRCNVDTNYSFQNPGRQWDTPESELFNDKRDLDILHRLGLTPGATRPALELFSRLHQQIPACRGICGYDEVTSEPWRGCALAGTGNYERGHAMGVDALIPPRPECEKAQTKTTSCREMYAAGELRIRPHHLMCMTCFHNGRQDIAPIHEDNLFEAIDIIRKNPDVPLTLVAGPCMICPPCSRYDPRRDVCVSANAMALRDQKKDLDVLQLLGLRYGDTLPAREIYRRLYEKVRSTTQICGYGDGVQRGYEWTVCGGPEGNQGYVKARAMGLGIRELKPE